MTDDIIVGSYVTVASPGDGTQEVQCPGCNHYIPRVPRSALIPCEQTGVADWIDCLCREGKGHTHMLHLVSVGCQCVARFSLRPSGTAGRATIDRVDEATMYARRKALIEASDRERDRQVVTAFVEEIPSPLFDEHAPIPKASRKKVAHHA